ncbi:FMN-dependent dehydrogenase-domain-containing protein [Cladochytrium replicatum]|nr:FMN-dependent dehydrogenase-domain-containing protein [Cladochytrium replicatum]
MDASISWDEIRKHISEGDCWIVVHGKVVDVSGFLSKHPGGAALILREAGKDATNAFLSVHNTTLLEDGAGYVRVIGTAEAKNSSVNAHPTEVVESRPKLPPLSTMLNLFDFEAVAKETLHAESWAYVSTGSSDEITLRENRSAFYRIWLKPRVLINVALVDTRTNILGFPSSLPIYISGAAMGKLMHPDGEVGLARAAVKKGIIQMIPTLSSCSYEEIVAARAPGQVQFFQLYISPYRERTAELVKRVANLGVKAIFVTVDAPVVARRERHTRAKLVHQTNIHTKLGADAKEETTAFMKHDMNFSWSDLKWLRELTSVPIVLKGVQTGEDAVLAARAGCPAIVISNHGGRQLDGSRAAIEVLAEVMAALRKEGLKMEVYVDGGIRRGTDVLKALALGANAVGIGRPFLYSLIYGQQGVERAIDLIGEEFEIAMKLMGTKTLGDISEKMLAWKDLTSHM